MICAHSKINTDSVAHSAGQKIDSLLDLVLPTPESFDHAEERRLLYVAMTRAKRSVTIMVDRANSSLFATVHLEAQAYGAVLLGATAGAPGSEAGSTVHSPHHTLRANVAE